MDYDIFENAKDKANARNTLPELVKQPGWKFVIKALDANIAFLSDDLKQKRDFTNLEEVYALQDRIDDFANLKDLPAAIAKAAQPDPEEPEEEEIY